MEGLEISEVLLSKLDKELLRLEAEYFQKEYFELQNILYDSDTIASKQAIITCGPFGSNLLDTLYVNNGIPVIRPFNIKNCTIEKENIVYIGESDARKNKLRLFKEGTLLFSRVGDIKIGLLNQQATISPNIIAVEFSDTTYSKFLAVFFQTYYGYKQIERQLKIAAQPTISTNIIAKLKIPNFSDSFTKTVIKLLDTSFNLQEKSIYAYRQAEELLLETIGLKDFQPSQENKTIKTFKESFLATGRLDAEYYQPKYEEIEKTFDKFERIALSDIVSYPISSGITPKAGGDDYTDSESGIPFIRAVDLVNGEININNFNYLKHDIHNGILKRTQLKKGDVLFSIAGTVGRCAIFNYNFEANINQAISILRFEESKVLRLYLVVFFNSSVGKEFVSKYARQGLQTNLNLEEVGSLKIPIITYNIQRRIAALITKSFSLRRESERLLSDAKELVEMEIERG